MGFCVDKKWHRYVYNKKKYLNKKIKYIQFSMTKAWKDSKRQIWYKMARKKMHKT